MMNKLIFGRYTPGDSLIHRLNPRVKLLASFYPIGITFLANNWETYLLSAFSTLLFVFLSEVDLKFLIRGIRPLIWPILSTIALRVLFTSGGETYWSQGVFHTIESGVINDLFTFCRFVLIIFMSTLFTLTTPSLELLDAIEYLPRLLKTVRFLVHETLLMLSIVLHFMFTLMDETEKIMSAQRTRGVDLGEGNLVQKMKVVIPSLIPLFVSSFNRAEDPATAMEARGYKGGEGRMKHRVLYWYNRDTMVIIAFVLLTVLLTFLGG